MNFILDVEDIKNKKEEMVKKREGGSKKQPDTGKEGL